MGYRHRPRPAALQPAYRALMTGNQTPPFLVRVRSAWKVLLGIYSAAPLADPPVQWTNLDIETLAAAPIGNRDRRILLLFCEGGRPTVPGEELTTKFGCGSPFDGARDLPRVHTFAVGRHLPSPIVQSGGTTEKPTYTVSWTHDQARLFAMNATQSDQQSGTANIDQAEGAPNPAQSPTPISTSA
jgi:hypothetical protein